MDDGEEIDLHGAEVAALMNLVATDTLVCQVHVKEIRLLFLLFAHIYYMEIL